MYLTGKIDIDPSQITVYKKVKPTKLFSKLVDALTFGSLSQKREHETFTAVAILQQLNIALRTLNIKNVIRLAVDDYDFYLDEKGEEDDLEQAMFEFKAKVDPIESEFFNTIYLVLEHIDDSIKYLIEISVYRKHKIGEYPIKINVNGVITDLKAQDGETAEQLKARLEPLFVSQGEYDNFIKTKKTIFNMFIDELEQAVRRFIKIDDIKKSTTVQVIRPNSKVTGKDQIRHERYADPVYYGYYGFDNYFLYSWLWADMLFSHNLYVNDFYMVDSIGNEVMNVGSMGFNAGDFNTLNTDAAFEAPGTGDISYFGENEYADTLADSDLIDETNSEAQQDTSSDWLSNDYDDIGGDDISYNACSSCGSCSSD
ncbi:MAG: hypothetical protein EPN82_10625 [Bacteroidetes bacterium]|nr:MAG: hypothetical protein EPN82_10625 [Bacteroidota bacterium]